MRSVNINTYQRAPNTMFCVLFSPFLSSLNYRMYAWWKYSTHQAEKSIENGLARCQRASALHWLKSFEMNALRRSQQISVMRYIVQAQIRNFVMLGFRTKCKIKIRIKTKLFPSEKSTIREKVAWKKEDQKSQKKITSRTGLVRHRIHISDGCGNTEETKQKIRWSANDFLHHKQHHRYFSWGAKRACSCARLRSCVSCVSSDAIMQTHHSIIIISIHDKQRH